MKKYKIGDIFLMMEFDIDSLSERFSLDDKGQCRTDKFDIFTCQVEMIDVRSFNQHYKNAKFGSKIVSRIKYIVSRPLLDSKELDIYTDDSTFNYFFRFDEKQKRKTVIVGKDIAEIKRNISKLSKAIIENLNPIIRNKFKG